MKKISENELITILNNKGFVLCGTYANSKTPISIRCLNCGTADSRYLYNLLKCKSKCKKCNPYTKYTFEYITNLVESKGGKVLSDITSFKNTDSVLKIICNKDHNEWSAKVSTIIGGKWCSRCARNKPYDLCDVKSFVDKKGGTLLSSFYSNVETKLDVKCSICDNIWHPTFKELLKDTWCSYCSQGKTQKYLAQILSEIYKENDIRTNYRNFDWLVNDESGRKLEVDIVVFAESFVLAVEYDGRQHFEAVNFGNNKAKAQEEFALTKKRDAIKAFKIKQSPHIDYFVRFNYKEHITEEYVRDKLLKCGVPT